MCVEQVIVEYKDELDSVRSSIKKCEDKGHIQQVAYSTYHDALTQICFSCGKIRTSLPEEETGGDE